MGKAKPKARVRGGHSMEIIPENMTWIYRGMIAALFALTLMLIEYEAGALSRAMDSLRIEITEFKRSTSNDINAIKTENAVSQVGLMALQAEIGEQAGRAAAQAERAGRTIDAMNAVRERVTIMETMYKEHIARTEGK